MMKKILMLALSSLMVPSCLWKYKQCRYVFKHIEKDGYGGPVSGQGQWQDVGRLLFGWRPYQEGSQLYC